MSCKIISIVFNLPTVYIFLGEGGVTHELYWKVKDLFFLTLIIQHFFLEETVARAPLMAKIKSLEWIQPE